MKSFSVVVMKVVRKLVNRVETWYYKTDFISKLKCAGKGIVVYGKTYLWSGKVSVGDKTAIYPGTVFWGDGEICIGSNVQVGFNTILYAASRIEIGDDTSIAANCYIIDSNHGFAAGQLIREQAQTIDGAVKIGRDVWLGAGVKVLSGVTIGDGAVVGAGAVVTKEIPENAIAVGVPAKVIGYRKQELRGHRV